MIDRKWIAAARPKTLSASLAPVIVGGSLAGFKEPMLLLYSLITALLIQIGTNLVNDAIDFQKGADTPKRQGPDRATQMGWLTVSQVLYGAYSVFLFAALASVPLMIKGGFGISVLIAASILSGYLYTGGPKPLAYVGLGDLFVLLFFGWAATMGVYFLQTGEMTLSAFVAGTQVGCLATVLIAINNLRDYQTDRLVGKKTLAVRFGVTFSRIEICTLIAVPFFLQFYWGFSEPFYLLPLGVLIGYRVVTETPGKKYNQLLGLAALLQLVFGGLLSFGFWAH